MEASILDNIVYGIDKEVDMEKIQAMAKALDIHEFISSLEKGYHTFITEDKPTSVLDSSSIKILINLLQKIKKDKIIFALTHHQEFVEIADEIIEFKKKDLPEDLAYEI